jgi:hypothetical protein
MLMFDASNRDQCEVKRMRTNTPLQALMMLNDPMVLEASRVLAERLATKESLPKDKIAQAFRLILCREGQEKELTLLETYYEDEKKHFEANPEKAKEFIKQGEYPHEEIKDTANLASLMQVVHTIYNMDEAITK